MLPTHSVSWFAVSLQPIPDQARPLAANLHLDAALVFEPLFHLLAEVSILQLADIEPLLVEVQQHPGIRLGVGQAHVDDHGQGQQAQQQPAALGSPSGPGTRKKSTSVSATTTALSQRKIAYWRRVL